MFINNLIISVIVIRLFLDYYKNSREEDILLKKFNDTLTFTLPFIVFIFILYSLFKDNKDKIFLENYELLYKIIILILSSGYIYNLIFNTILSDNIVENDLLKKYNIKSQDKIVQNVRIRKNNGENCDIFCEYKDGKIKQKLSGSGCKKPFFCFGASAHLKSYIKTIKELYPNTYDIVNYILLFVLYIVGPAALFYAINVFGNDFFKNEFI